jgi:hypothetical protein
LAQRLLNLGEPLQPLRERQGLRTPRPANAKAGPPSTDRLCSSFACLSFSKNESESKKSARSNS